MASPNLVISVVKTRPTYPQPPFSPSARFPEYPFPASTLSVTPNPLYGAVRESLRLLGLDSSNYGTPYWNPLKGLLPQGGRVIIKPNFVSHFNPLSDDQAHFEALVTQGAVLRPILDYVILAATEGCRVTIADLPIQLANFSEIASRTGLDELTAFVRLHAGDRIRIEYLDLRDYWLVTDRAGAIMGRENLPGDPEGYVVVDLGAASSLAFLDRSAHLFRCPERPAPTTVAMHTEGRHQYVLPKTILRSDLFINVPKLKVHRKVGVTLSLKNLVGIIGDKASCPHWRAGSPESYGDEYPVATAVHALRSRADFPLRRLGPTVWRLVKPFGRVLVRLDEMAHSRRPLREIINGDWYGNDTAWRMVHDLNRIILYADGEGILRPTAQRAYLAIVDGIVGGQGEGPLKPSPVPCGIVAAGRDPVALDVTCAAIMGFDWRRIPLLGNYDPSAPFPFSGFAGDPASIETRVAEYSLDRTGPMRDLPRFRFVPPRGWSEHLGAA